MSAALGSLATSRTRGVVRHDRPAAARGAGAAARSGALLRAGRHRQPRRGGSRPARIRAERLAAADRRGQHAAPHGRGEAVRGATGTYVVDVAVFQGGGAYAVQLYELQEPSERPPGVTGDSRISFAETDRRMARRRLQPAGRQLGCGARRGRALTGLRSRARWLLCLCGGRHVWPAARQARAHVDRSSSRTSWRSMRAAAAIRCVRVSEGARARARRGAHARCPRYRPLPDAVRATIKADAKAAP